VATTGQGTDELVAEIGRFRAASTPAVRDRRRVRAEHRLRERLAERAIDYFERHVLAAGELAAIVDRIATLELDPYSAADEILKRAGLTVREAVSRD
jgi:putative protein kinase ArgK-like GTPase of G3E family